MSERINVVMLDGLSIVPYYTGHLCAGLSRADRVQVRLASINYHCDPDYFRRARIRMFPGLIDVAGKLRRIPLTARRVLKVVEYLINLAMLLVRFTFLRPDVLHVQFLPLAGYGLPAELWFLRLARFLGVGLVHTVHNVLPQDSGDRHHATFERIYHLADRLICHDALAASRLTLEFGVAPESISVIPHGPLFEEGRSAGASGTLPGNGHAGQDCLVLWQGILRPYKGVPFLLNAWKRVCDSEPGAQLAIVGTGDHNLVKAVEEQVRALGIQSRVRLELRFVSVEELAAFYEAADILVYPYSEVTTSGALLTGVVRGKAIVASRLPAFEQILRHGDTGLLAPYGDVDELAAALLALIRDSAFREAMGRRLLEAQTRFPRWSQIANRTCECYRAALAAQPRCSPGAVTT